MIVFREYPIRPERFVVVWQGSGCVAEVAAVLRMSRSAVRSRASYYRRRGIRLKRMGRNRE